MKAFALSLEPRQTLERKFPVVRVGSMVETPFGPGNQQFELGKGELFSLGVGVGAAFQPAHFRFGRRHGYFFSSRLSHFLACAFTFFGAVPP